MKRKTSIKHSRPPMTSTERVNKYRHELDELAKSFGWQSWQDFTRAVKSRQVDMPAKSQSVSQ